MDTAEIRSLVYRGTSWPSFKLAIFLSAFCGFDEVQLVGGN